MHTYTVVSLELSHIIECVYFDILDTVFFEILDGTSIRKRIKKIGENNINIIFSYFSVLGCGKQGNETNTFWAYAVIARNFSAIKRSIEDLCKSKGYTFLDITHNIRSHATKFANADSQGVTDKVVYEIPDIGVLPRTKGRVQQSRRSVREVLDTHFKREYPEDIVHLVIFVPVKEST